MVILLLLKTDFFWLCWVFVAAQGQQGWGGGGRWLSLVAVGGLLIAVASLVAERLKGSRAQAQ